MFISVEAMAYSLLVTAIISLIINAWPNKKLLNYHILEQIKDVLPIVCISAVMGTVVYMVTLLKLNDWLTLVIQVPLGVALYIGLSKILKLEPYTYCLNLLKDLFFKKQKKREK